MELLYLRLISLFFCFISPLSAGTGNETDKLALLEFKAKIDGDPLGLLSSWNESVHFCAWPGIACSRRHQQRVTVLDVSAWQLAGQLSPHVGNLSFLRRLNLTHNGFTLEIPPEIGRLFRLQVLDIMNNSFSGEIPRNISRCRSLRFLGLVSNNVSGRIPEDIGSLSELRTLELSSNQLVGEIPASIGNISSLVNLYLVTNNLRGTIPYSLSRLKSLRSLVLTMNNLTGTVPPLLYNMSTIEDFGVSYNRLKGRLPPNLGNTLPNLQRFYFDSNKFSGTIPATVSNASNLIIFYVISNYLTGKVPSFSKSLNLKFLGLSGNNLGYGENDDMNFLHGLVNNTNLELLGIEENNLGGVIPENIGNVTSLKRITFGVNQISGNIPTGIGNLVNLEALGLEFNYLTGPIPTTIGKLRKLVALTFYTNELSGVIPSSVQNLTSLSTLSLGSNNLRGNIPASLGECKNLEELILSGNNLSGSIPLQIVSLSSLSRVLDLSRNRLTGLIPLEVGKLVNLLYLDVSDNNLSGEIPKALGSCISMEILYLEGNFLHGSIPEELKSLRGTEEIDLSRNNLSGKIPSYLVEFRALLNLNLSFNDFEGQVPEKGVFKNGSQFSVVGNTRLCGGLPELRLPTCESNSNTLKNHKLSPKIKTVIIVSCSVGGLIVIVLLSMLAFRSRKRSKQVTEPSIGVTLPRVSYGDLCKATDGFSSSNLIGVGSFGSIYKGIMSQDDKTIAVKVLNLHVSRAMKSFAAEIESLRIVKHRNLVKLLTICSSIDFQGNDFKALVYELMENGSLEKWLHSGQVTLSLVQRINIAIDVGSALDYLHKDCPESIAHCDIKPSNILLDQDMVAYLGDFGLARLLRSAFSSSNETSSVGVRGTVGYVAPEYATGNEVSTMGDIYSYGILLLEMFTGKRPTDNMFKDDFDLHSFASMALPERLREIIDPVLLENVVVHRRGDQDQTVDKTLLSVVETGVACSSRNPGERRNISVVVAELRRMRDTLNARRRRRYNGRDA